MKRAVLVAFFLFQVSYLSYAPATPIPLDPKQLPITIQAKDETWTIEIVHCAAFPGISLFLPPSDEACPYAGFTLTDIHKVYILRGQLPDQERDTVLHELMHVAIGVDRSDESTTMHNAIYAIAPPLAKILIQNPQLLDYFNVKK